MLRPDTAMPDKSPDHTDANASTAMLPNVSHPEELASMTRAQLITGMSRTYIYGHLDDAENPFPRPIKIGSRSFWAVSELHRWVHRQIAESPRAGIKMRAGKRMGKIKVS